MNVELLRQVQEKIREHPEHFDMSQFFDWRFSTLQAMDEEELIHGCETTACIAGWGALLAGLKNYEWEDEIVNKALAFFDISSSQGDKLFYCEEWPTEFALRYENAQEEGDDAAAAQVACERIEHFIATEGRE